MKKKLRLGLERLLDDPLPFAGGERVGLICNPATVDHGFRHAADLFHNSPGINLTALFGPQHGIRGETQDNMIEWEGFCDRRTAVMAYSLYGEVRRPTPEMLEDIDCLVFDVQDTGTRVYTFIYTMALAMQAARAEGKRFLVLDRPNPIGGTEVEGGLLEPGWESFVGMYPIPMRHGMTVGELARLFNEEYGIGCDLTVVSMEGYDRSMWFDDTDAPWVLPSPNMPTLETATVYPGAVFVEGTRVSEGRGTTRPFEINGAPYVDAADLAEHLNGLGLPGVWFRAHSFQPTFQKHAGVLCGGVQIHVLERRIFRPVITGIALIKAIRDMYPEDFAWQDPPYEYVYDRCPFDVIAGTGELRSQIESGASVEDIAAGWREDERAFDDLRRRYLLY
ncbi:MAG: DUF1343 domain-containing protein [Acidobacteria bacterium]|nr:DUF1343 domain-containing protein [Acidobacteriota bacterium]MCW5971088.1 DUF1343 domain-containing protein [Blastocatellales bacterium]